MYPLSVFSTSILKIYFFSGEIFTLLQLKTFYLFHGQVFLVLVTYKSYINQIGILISIARVASLNYRQ